MSPLEGLIILAMTSWAIYKQTQTSEVRQHGRFKMAVIYGIVALCVGGFVQPTGATAWMLLTASIVLSVIVGIGRGLLTRIWVESTGKVMRRGTAVTIGLFLALILAKVAIGAFAYVDHIQDGATFAEIMLMIAIMIAVQAEIVWRRARLLGAAQATPAPVSVQGMPMPPQ